MKSEGIWYAYSGKAYSGNQPSFYDPKQFDWSDCIIKSFPEIQKELIGFLNGPDPVLKPYFNKDLVKAPDSWSTAVFLLWGKRELKNIERIPFTWNIFSKIHGLTGLGISVMEPGAEISTHNGDTNAIMRCHLGLVIDESSNPPFLIVNGEKRFWKEGELICFCDALPHSAHNVTKEKRVVLIFDVLNQEFSDQIKVVCANVNSWLKLQNLSLSSKIIANSPAFVRILLRKTIYWFYRLQKLQ